MIRNLAVTTIVAILTFGFFNNPMSVEAGILKNLGQIVSTSISQIKIESPAGKKMGFKIEGNHMELTNGTPFIVAYFAGDKHTITLWPGEIAYAEIGAELLGLNWEPLNQKVPVIARAYLNEDHLSQGRYLGYGGKVMNFSSQSPRTETWTVKISDFRTPDGHNLGNAAAYPSLPIKTPRTQKVKVSRESWNATSLVQVVNNSFFEGNIFIDGQFRATLQPGEIYFLRARELHGYRGKTLSVHMAFSENGIFEGTFTGVFQVPSSGIVAKQFLVGPQNIRR